MKLLLCVDGSKESKKALQQGMLIAKGCGADLVTVLHVFERVPPPAAPGASQSDADTLEVHEEILQRAFDELVRHEITAEKRLEEGPPAATISRIAEEGQYTMVILGSRGLSGLKKKLLGSVSNAVLQDTHTSVLVVK